jgi:hypothetical protein
MAFLRPPIRMRPVRQQGRAFYTTALIITLLACFSYLRGFGHDVPTQDLAARSLEARDLEVCSVHCLSRTAPYLIARLVSTRPHRKGQMRLRTHELS